MHGERIRLGGLPIVLICLVLAAATAAAEEGRVIVVIIPLRPPTLRHAGNMAPCRVIGVRRYSILSSDHLARQLAPIRDAGRPLAAMMDGLPEHLDKQFSPLRRRHDACLCEFFGRAPAGGCKVCGRR